MEVDLTEQRRVYKIDWDKVNSLEDVLTILKALNLRVTKSFDGYDELESYLEEAEQEEIGI